MRRGRRSCQMHGFFASKSESCVTRPTSGELSLTALSSLLLVWAGLGVGTPRGDFANYWTAATLWTEGADLSLLYDYAWFTDQAARVGFEDLLVGFPVLTPPSVLFAVPLLPLGLEGGRLAWLLLQLLLALATGLMSARAARLPLWTGPLAFLLVWPAMAGHLMQGQFHLPAAACLAGGLWAWASERDLLAGALFGLATGLKLFAWPLVLLPLLVGRRRATLSALGVMALGGLASIGLVGWELHALFLAEILPAASSGFFMDPWHQGMQSMGALCRALWLPEPRGASVLWFDSAPLAFVLPAAYGLFLPLLALAGAASWGRLHESQRGRLVAAAAFAAMVSAQYIASYSLVLLVPVVLFALGGRDRRPSLPRAVALVLVLCATAWAPVPAEWPEPFALLGVPRAVGLLVAWGLVMPWSRSPRRMGANALALALAALVGWRAIPSVPLDVDGASPLDTPGQPLVISGLALSERSGSLVFTALSSDRGEAPGQGWVGMSALPGGSIEVLYTQPKTHVGRPRPMGAAMLWTDSTYAPQEPVPCGEGTLHVVGGPLSGDLVYETAEGRTLLSPHPGHDTEPVCDPVARRVWFLSDRGVGVAALQIWSVPLPTP